MPQSSDQSLASAARVRLAVVLLTLNEEVNLLQALDSVAGWADRIVIFDSGSTDRTVALATERGCIVKHHPFAGYGNQRNAAIEFARPLADWILFLDADEWVTKELQSEISSVIAANPPENGYYIKRRLIWMGRWIRRGYYPVWILRLARAGSVRCEARSVNEHLLVDGAVGRLEADFIHQDRKGVHDWIAKHNVYASREAEELLKSEGGQIVPSPRGSQAEQKRWVKLRVWNRLPPLVRPCIYFAYRYVLRGGFLDGAAGFSYHALQAFWLQLLIDVKYLELVAKRRS